jgi:hypothetical protein
MKISTNDIIDSLRSIQRSLRTLTGVKSYMIDDIPLVISCEENVISFRVIKNNCHYKMSVWIVPDSVDGVKCENRAWLLANVDCSLFVEYGYYSDELTICTIDGYCENRSFVLEAIPNGVSFRDWLEQEVHSKTEKVRLAKEFIAAAKELSETGLCIGNIKPSNVVITSTQKIKFTDYRNLTHNVKSNSDSRVLYVFSVVALLSAVDVISPEIDGSLRSLTKLKSAIWTATERQLFDVVMAERLLEGIESVDWGVLDELLCYVKLAIKDNVPSGPYKMIGSYCEDVAVAQLKGRYGYINRDGVPVTEFKYTIAEDILESYAVVGIDSKFGVIHKTGREILSVEFEDVVMPDDCRIILAKYDGYWSVYDLGGVRIGNQKFDEILRFCPRSVPVSKDGKWGALNNQGELSLPCMYDSIEKISDDELLLRIGDRKIRWRPQ